VWLVCLYEQVDPDIVRRWSTQIMREKGSPLSAMLVVHRNDSVVVSLAVLTEMRDGPLMDSKLSPLLPSSSRPEKRLSHHSGLVALPTKVRPS
jgi:hypothetical protein